MKIMKVGFQGSIQESKYTLNMDSTSKTDDIKNTSPANVTTSLFAKIVYFASGSIGDDVSTILKNSSAESTCLLSDSVTHCIVGDNFVEDDVSAARELYDVITVTPEWIRMSVVCNRLMPTKPFNPFEDNLFKGVVACVSQINANDCKTLWALVTYNGGTFSLTLDLNKTTHLVITNPSGKKYDVALSKASEKIKIVTPDWIIDSLKKKELYPENIYHPRLLIMPKLPVTSNNPPHKLQTSGLSTITGFADFEVPVEQPEVVVTKNQGLEQLKQRLPWNQPSTPPTSQPIQVSSPQVSQGTQQPISGTQQKSTMSLMSTPQLQRLSQQQVQQLQLQQQNHVNNQTLPQQQIHIPQQQNQFPQQQQIRAQQIQQAKQIQLQHGQQLQFQPNQQQQQIQQNHTQLQQTQLQQTQPQQTHLQIMHKGQQQQQNQQHLQVQQKLPQLQPGQQQITLQQQTVQLQQGQQHIQLQQQPNVQQLQTGQHSTQISQLQQQNIQMQSGQPQQVQIPQLQQQAVQIQQTQMSQLQKQQIPNQLQQQLQQGQQIQQLQFQTGNNQFQQQQQQGVQNAQVHTQQQQQQPQIQNVQSSQPSQICIVSNGQQMQQSQTNSQTQQQILIQQQQQQQQQQRLLFQQRIVQQGGGTVSTQWRMAPPSANMSRVQVNQQQNQQIQQQQTLVVGQQAQQPVNNISVTNTQPTTQTQWAQQQTLTVQRTIQQPLDQRLIWSQQSPHGPQQMIHMDAKTHQQIQAMNPADRLVFINKLTKQRNIVLQQFNARQQQVAGIGGTNIRQNTPNGQKTVIRTLNHQLISTSGMTPAQQAQWNQMRQQQLLVQQQQMAGGTVTTGLSTNVKTVNNTLVNNQQANQPQTTVWQQSAVTEQGHQQAPATNMSSTQLAQLHQRQQIHQLRLQQQLQMDATQKQQVMQQQQVVSGQPITGVMQQQNVVQPSQVASVSTPIVQNQQTVPLPANDQTETPSTGSEAFAQTSQTNQQVLVVNPKTKTALANMLSIRLQNGISSSSSTQQMSGQEISAAGQLRLMTAQHHAAQHQNQPQGTQGAYQSRTVLNNVTNSSPSNRTAQVVSRASLQTPVNNKAIPANYNQSAAVRVAAVLAKSAAGQTVGHQQQLPHQARFFGHNPNLKLPPDKCLVGCVFLIVEYDRCADTINDVPTWKQIILEHGGEIEPSYTLRLTHILCQTQKHPLVQQGLRDGKRCITAYWLSDIITKQQLMPPWYALHFPTPYCEERPCRQMMISLTNFESEERNRVKFMIELTGARVTSYFSAENNILVSRKLEGKKVKKARDTNRPVVNVQWLNEILFGHLSCMYQPENAKYQQFNLSNPFRVDYSLVHHLMGAWKIPINVTQELYDRIRNNPVAAKRKRPRPGVGLPDFIDQENNDLSTADIIITNINPPPIEYRPCVMLSGFGLAKEEQRMVLQLGGTIAKKFSDATHLVMKESVRTTKFLCCLSTVKHIVTADWLKDSSTQHMFLGEAIYTIEEVSVDQKVVCKVHKILSNPSRQELFKGKIFYVTPGVNHPPAFVVRQIIESAGGTVEKQRRSLRSIQEFEPNMYIVVACNNDLHLVADLIRASFGIYSSEFVLSAIMTQYINYNMAYKKQKIKSEK